MVSVGRGSWISRDNSKLEGEVTIRRSGLGLKEGRVERRGAWRPKRGVKEWATLFEREKGDGAKASKEGDILLGDGDGDGL